SSVTSHMEAFQNMPTHIKTAWFYFDGKIWNHDGGAKLDATKVIVPNAEEITMRSGTHRMNAETTAESASISVNPLALANPATYAAAGSVNVSEQSSTQSQTIHDHATILADYVFIRSKNMLVTGASVRSKVIDVMLEDDLLLESVVNEISQETQGMSVGLSTSMMYGDGVLDKISGLGDMAFSNTESKRRWIEQKTAFIATEQLYLTVGKNYITRSAHAKREGQDKAPDYHARNAAGNTLRFFERQMPITDNACAFYSLDIKGENGQSVRKSGTDLLLNHSGNEEIRNLLAYEIFDKTINSNEHDLRVLNAILPGMADYRASRETLRSTKSWSDMDALDDTIKQWARNELTYRSYVEGYLSKSNVMLEYFNDTSSFKPMTSSMDALAKIKGYDLNIYVQAQDDTGAYLNDQLTLVHAFKGGDKPINIIHVPHDPKQPQRLNHFNRLEETQDFTKAAHRIEEFFPEENGAVETKSGHDILLPFATVGTFAANVRDGVKWLEAQQFIETERAKNAYQQAKDLGKSEDEARADGENERQEVRAENNIASALNDAVEEEPSSSKTKTSVPRTTMVSDKDLQTWSEALTAALNYDEGTNLGGDFSKRLTNQAKSRHQHYKAQGLSDEQAWTNVRFEIGESIRHLENKPQLHDVVWGVAGKIAIEGFKKLAPRVLEKLGKESAKKAAQEAAKETTKKVSKKAAKEQPWIIRPGQEWKGKVVGKAQKTGTPGHAGQSYKEAIKEAKKPDVEKVFLNRGLKKSSGHPIQKPNNRPDVTIRTKDGKIHQTEVPSKTDKDYLLEKRMDDATSRLPKQMRGDNKLAHIS
ncbi:MAG: hemagglutinin repeat-containing protein, partial [Candidatus Paracaedibacteraceae bacterium]|nr:hemagglutinin repeat-containing protein [Candidatus Paracaedibacteraceae bacterium]